ncbi:MAG: hypothetical protein FWC98_03125 [Bacteroidales bacterium]|nr:hypothetical protein [Bacteroidales bacterium]
MNSVEKLFESKAIMSGGIMLFTKENALLFIEACKEYGVPILGIDAFYLWGNSVQPSMENSVDFSMPDYMLKTENVYSDAVVFFEEKNENLFFEIVCG